MTDEKQKVLVIEDFIGDTREYRFALGDKVDLPIVNIDGIDSRVDVEASLKNIETCLRETSYAIIFMDGQLYLNLQSHYDKACDGAILVRRIRDGEYGTLNQDTEIQNISSAYKMWGTKKDCDKERLADGTKADPIQYARNALGIETTMEIN